MEGENMNLNDIQVIVFDLDGTLYEDTHHFSYYADCLQDRLAKEKRRLFKEDYHAALSGKHPLQIGRIYDATHDLILVQMEGRVTQAYEWSGESCSEERVKKLYSHPITVDLDQMLSIGDLWWVPGSIARHYGLDHEQSYEAFLDTRRYMMSAEFQMHPVKGLRESMEKWKTRCNMVLMTNSPQPDSEAILQKLHLQDLFDHKVFEAQKPIRTKQHLEEIRHKYGISFTEILSVGDNWINEILPAQELGCQTLLIDPYHRSKAGQANRIVNRIGEIISILN